MEVSLLQDPVFAAGAALIVLGVLALLIDMIFPVKKAAPLAAMTVASAEKKEVAAAVAEAVAAEAPKDPIAEHRRFFGTLGTALSVDEDAPVALAALHTNLTSDMFMERMTLAVKAWRPDGFASGAHDMLLKADGTPPDTVAAKVVEGYEELRAGNVKASMEAFLVAIESAKGQATGDQGTPWPHAWSAFAWRGLALIAEEAGDVQATLAGLKVAYHSMLNAFEVTLESGPVAPAVSAPSAPVAEAVKAVAEAAQPAGEMPKAA